jgi:hypothetical protein
MSQTADRKSRLSREAVMALGNVSPELAWLQIRDMVMGAQLDYTGAANELFGLHRYDLPYRNLEEMSGDLEGFPRDGVRPINLLVASNPHLDLRDIPHLPVLEPLKAVLKMLTRNEAFS